MVFGEEHKSEGASIIREYWALIIEEYYTKRRGNSVPQIKVASGVSVYSD